MFKRLTRLALELTKLVIIIFSLISILYITIFKILFFALVDSSTINERVLEMSDMRFNIFIIFVFLSAGWFIAYRQKQITVVNPLKLDKEESISYAIMALFFSYYFTKSFAFLTTFGVTSILTLGSLFFFIIPQLVIFCSTLGYKNINQLQHYFVTTFTRQNIINFTKNLLVVTLVLVLGVYSLFVTVFTYKNSHDYQKVLSENLFITEISPHKTTYAYKVTLQGYNFGGTTDYRYKLYSSFGPVITNTWTDKKIEFVIPLHWKEGEVALWIERPNRFDDKRTEVSNAMKLQLLNRWEFFPTADDLMQARLIKRFMRVLYLDYWNNLSFVWPF